MHGLKLQAGYWTTEKTHEGMLLTIWRPAVIFGLRFLLNKTLGFFPSFVKLLVLCRGFTVKIVSPQCPVANRDASPFNNPKMWDEVFQPRVQGRACQTATARRALSPCQLTVDEGRRPNLCYAACRSPGFTEWHFMRIRKEQSCVALMRIR